MAVEVRMVFLIFLCCLLGVVSGKEFVPAYIWSSSEYAPTTFTALKLLSTSDFMDSFVKRLESKPLVLVFLEENLSVEDFSDDQFPKLKSLGKSSEFNYGVKSPLAALKKAIPVHSTLEDIPEVGSALVVLKMDDATTDEDRSQLLRRHDARMSKVYTEALKVRKDVVAVYTGHYTSWTEPEVHRVSRRRLLEDTTPNNSSQMVLVTENILVYASEWPKLDMFNKTMSLNYITSTQNVMSNFQSLNVRFKTNTSSDMRIIKFFFYNSTSTTGYWSLENITIVEPDKPEVVLKPQSNIVAPVGFSYHCTGETVVANENISLIFKNFQAQAYMDVKGTFGDACNCELFFTAPIWSGLFVMTILAMIMIWGLVMIMDIRTMDQFDDPKGKTITISAVE